MKAERLPVACVALCLLQAAFGVGPRRAAQPQAEKHAVTVADAIEMTRFADPQYTNGGPSDNLVARFSPDDRRFVVVLKRGNLKDNTNEYSLLMWRTTDLFLNPTPEILFSLSSSSNREGIKNVTWLNNETVAFLGEGTGRLQQVHLFNLTTRMMSALTEQSTSVVAYSLSPDVNRLVFVAERPTERVLDQEAQRHGIWISDADSLPDLIGGHRNPEDAFDLFVRTGRRAPIAITTEGPLSSEDLYGEPVLSPDGKYLVVRTQTTNLPPSWKEYTEPFLRHVMDEKSPKGRPSRIEKYELIDATSGATQILLDAPVSVYGSEAVWSHDSRSVVLADVYLPLDDTDGEERKTRRDSAFVVEVSIQDKQIVKVAKGNLKLLGWDKRENCIVLADDRLSTTSKQTVFCRKKDNSWQRLADTIAEPTRPDVVLEEDLNTPPRIIAVEPRTHQRALLLDLNPRFKGLDFGHVEEISWQGTDEHRVVGGLYFPATYVPGRKYPLVIQTHGFTSKRFLIDGPFTTAFAAQPLAARGFVVLQVDESSSDPDTPQEVKREVSGFEGAIDHLDKLGLIDRNLIGIVGFSRTCIFVQYALTHSPYRFAAALVADGTDAGYFQYLAFSNWSTFEGINGGSPFGKSLLSWIKNSPGFNLDRVSTPVAIQAIGPGSLLAEWEWFSGLTRLRKPVDMIYIPDGVHILEKPWERMASQEATVDWFCFWLKGEEDPDPAKAEQYARWRELRKLQEQNQSAAPTN
jgi:dipeptidyl aminopeptidase/acylaminoacyl peptidase